MKKEVTGSNLHFKNHPGYSMKTDSRGHVAGGTEIHLKAITKSCSNNNKFLNICEKKRKCKKDLHIILGRENAFYVCYKIQDSKKNDKLDNIKNKKFYVSKK